MKGRNRISKSNKECGVEPTLTVVQAAAFVFRSSCSAVVGTFIELNDAPQSAAKDLVFKARKTANKIHHKNSGAFSNIPGSPIAFWASETFLHSFSSEKIGGILVGEGKNITADNEQFLRLHWETCFRDVGMKKKWLKYSKGGNYRKWAGNLEYLVNWSPEARAHYRSHPSARIIPEKYWYMEGVTWSPISTIGASFRHLPSGMTFDTKGLAVFPAEGVSIIFMLAALNSVYARQALNLLNPTLSVNLIDIKAIPLPAIQITDELLHGVSELILLGQSDWDAYETSWDFTTLPLLQPDHRDETLEASYTTLRAHWQSMTGEMQRLEEENNRIFIDAYGLQDELTPEVPLKEITLTCNPAYSIKGDIDDATRETKLRARTAEEFLSYAVGCMFGRYSLDAPGLILANQGETLVDYLARVPKPTFMPDEDNVIPVLDADWFSDDITERFRLFLRTTFGEDHFRENLKYIEDALGKDIRKYFTKDFYTAHVKRYKKRPIYWMFSSPKGTFNALIYMHRYQSDTVSVLLNDYVREFITKLEGERARLDKQADDPTATQGQKTKAIKDASVVAKQLVELNEWEREVIFPLAQQKIEIDLDDGVKANYPKFGTALKKIVGVSQ